MAELFAWGMTMSRPFWTVACSTSVMAAMMPAISLPWVPPATNTVPPGSLPARM